MKKILLAASLITAMIAGVSEKASATYLVTYSGQSQLTPILAGNNLYRLDCNAAVKDCCTVDWDTWTVTVYAMVMPDDGGQGGETGGGSTPGTYNGHVRPNTLTEKPDGSIDGGRTVTMVAYDLVPQQ